MVAFRILLLIVFFLSQVCKSDPLPKPLDEINVHFHLDDESSESAEDIGKSAPAKEANRGLEGKTLSYEYREYESPEDNDLEGKTFSYRVSSKEYVYKPHPKTLEPAYWNYG
ncbi:uncharacterized protein LOC111718162 isoform X2 [Eurytemora carolleeae]|uniref:uncharacterized protein LOC111718162 isoform X2 n=1 Tax=Eurytemora carolleeae TaxID=1294199 RepID=UPI000C775DDC|nr:uncharacterized protein LOC111718162 isoform X2 [Eurytemora carolleeae]|eukprot:XP_023349448.1 uncharacterized protein LOC111718162 isoform X2 [Eurytemora affinis]